jgi:hypothetical protein
MNRITSVIKIHSRNKFTWFFLPWIILLSSFVINLFISFLIGGKTAIYTGGLASIYIYMLVAGIFTLRDSFPFALGFSIRRTDYFLGTVGMVVAVSAVTAILLLLLSFTESELIRGWGLELHFFHLPYVNDGPLIGQLWIFFVVMVHMYLLGFAIASVYQRFGRTGMYVFFIAAFLLVSVCTYVFTYFNWWRDIFRWLSHYSASELASWLVLAIAAYALVSYALLRKATV